MLTNKDYCDYDTQKSLMELGFPMKAQSYDLGSGLKEYLPKIHIYDAQKWLREVRNLHIEVGYNPILSWYVYRVWEHQDEIAEGEAFPTYEDALKTAIYMTIEFLKEKNNGN